MLNSFRIPWASDRWFGEDKLTHFVWCYAGALTLLFLLPWLVALGLVAIVAIVVELVQWVRWDIWNNAVNRARDSSEAAQPRPTFADQPSYRDLAWDAGGIVVALGVWLLVRLVQ
jgi:uncharacterized protein YfiM (DUF2279 family)